MLEPETKSWWRGPVLRVPSAHFLGLLLVLVLSTLLGVFGYFNLKLQRNEQEKLLITAAERVSDVIARSTNYQMLHNDRAALKQMIDNMGTEPGMRRVRVFNPQGLICYSSVASEVGKVVDKNAEACFGCHAQSQPMTKLARTDRTRVVTEPSGGRYLGTIHPVENEATCSNAACHVHPASQRVLGVIDAQLSLEAVDQLWRSQRNRLIGFWVFAVLLVSGISAGFVWLVADKASELERAKHTLFERERLASLGKLAATVAHEVNNPLFGILTYARLSQKELKTGIDSGKLAERLKTIERESQRCGELVKNLLGYARSAPKPVESSEVRKVVERGLGLVSYRLKTQNVALETAFEEGLPPAACEQGPLEQVILAITMNAVEAMPNGGTLRVECGTSHGSVRIAIKDTGPGISDKVLPHIFEPFFSTKEEPERTGLGLAVAKEIVEGRHGKLQARNRVSGGAEMVILLPAAPVGEEMKV